MIDAWYDSGVDAVRPVGLPAPATTSVFERRYPAQFICEAIDQTRGWFYTLMAVGTLVFDRSSYENVLCLGPHPGRGRPQDDQAPRQHPRADPADGPARRRRGALVHGRRRLAVVGPPGRARHAAGGRPQGAADLLEHRRVPRPVRPRRRLDAVGAPTRRRPTGRCSTAGCSSELHRAGRATSTRRWRTSTPQRGRQLLAAFVDDLSNWYVRRTRRRFWDGDPAALATLHEALRRSPG